MVKVNIGGCSSFVKESECKEYVEKALSAFDVLESETGAGNDFLGWKHLPSETPEELVKACEDVRDDWKSRNVDLVVVIGIGGSYLGASRLFRTASRENFTARMFLRLFSPAITCQRSM